MRRAAVLLALLAVAGSAQASGLFNDDGFCGGFLEPKCGKYVLFGLSGGAAIHDGSRDSGATFGLEVSVPRLTRSGWWYGGYADVVFDFGGDNTARASLGPEGGFKYLGLDGGLLYEGGEDGALGVTVRGLATLGLAAFFVRYGRYFDGPAPNQLEIGVLFKVPLRP